jgi:hypothetical protein
MKCYNTKDIIDALNNGAKLHKHYGVYNYFWLELPNGENIYKIRKNAPQLVMAKISYNLEVHKGGFTITKDLINV